MSQSYKSPLKKLSQIYFSPKRLPVPNITPKVCFALSGLAWQRGCVFCANISCWTRHQDSVLLLSLLVLCYTGYRLNITASAANHSLAHGCVLSDNLLACCWTTGSGVCVPWAQRNIVSTIHSQSFSPPNDHCEVNCKLAKCYKQHIKDWWIAHSSGTVEALNMLWWMYACT